MRATARGSAAIIALFVAGFASLATSPLPPSTGVSSHDDQLLTLNPSAPTLVRHVNARITPGDGADTARAEVYINWTEAGPEPIVISVVRDADGTAVTLDALPEWLRSGHYGGRFVPFPTCNSGSVCEASFTVTFRLVATEQVPAEWTFAVDLETGSPATASSTTVQAKIVR